MDNLRQLMNGVMLYTRDNHDYFPPNPDDGNMVPGHTWYGGGVAGIGGSRQFDPDILGDPNRCLITPYVQTNVSLFRCPSDLRVGVYQGADPAKIGTRVPAARSISMNTAVGTICPGWSTASGHSGKPIFPVQGAWLDNAHSHIRNNPWRTFGKVSEILVPGPARLWVLIEEDVYSLNDGTFAIGLNNPEWIDWPATRHAMSGVVAYADGNVELHKWVDQRTRVINGSVARRPVAGSADWAWLAERTSARAQ